MSAVTVSHVSPKVDLYKLQEFFSFCGKVLSINDIDTDSKGFKTYQVNFTSEKAVETALLLNEAELENEQVKVSKSTLPTYEEAKKSGAKSNLANADNKIQSDTKGATNTGDDSYDDISQEEKPKLAILAQLLASGYKVSDDLIGRAIKIDNEKGVSTKFKSFLTSLDEKYLHSQDPKSSINKAGSQLNSLSEQVQKSTYLQKLQHYFEQATATPYGAKVHEFYKQVSKEVLDVHNEAKRLAELKKAEAANATGGSSALTGSSAKA